MYGKCCNLISASVKMLGLVALLYLFALSKGQGGPGTGDDWVLNFDSPVYVCSDEESQAWVDTSKMDVIRHNETTAFLTGKVHFLKGVKKNTMVELLVEKEANGRYELALSHEICDLCTEIAIMDESEYHEYLKFFGFPEKCPFNEGEYDIMDYIADTSDFPVNRQNSGRYQVTINLYDGTCGGDNKVFMACLKLDFVIEPL